jgi:hypothetical protein
MATRPKEIIVVRSLTDSDFGLFSAHRAGMASKQRAIAITASVARQMLSSEVFEAGGAIFECKVTFGRLTIRQPRTLSKPGKNWRLGGKKIEGESFALLDSKDFVLIRSTAANDGSAPLAITFICRNTDRVAHAGLAAIVEKSLSDSMVVFDEGSDGFEALKSYCQPATHTPVAPTPKKRPRKEFKPPPSIAPMPRDPATEQPKRKPTIHEKVRSPHIMERMFRVAGDLSAPAQLRFIEIVEKLADQLRKVLLATGGIVKVAHNHKAFWPSVAGKPIGFIDGGLANLSMLGSAPIAARVGGYLVTPGQIGDGREQFTMLKHLIDELFSHADGGIYDDSFPDIGALRDAARISIEAAGAVQMLRQYPDVKWILMHGALVNPVSRYTDVMQDGRVRHRFPDFSDSALAELLPGEPPRTGRDRNFISVYLRQLQLLRDSAPIVCGVVEREATTSIVIRALLRSLDDHTIASLLPVSPAEWKSWFLHQIDPADDPDSEGQRITDSLLLRCVLEPGEALAPVMVDRNELRRAPPAWRDSHIVHYPPPYLSYIQVSEWSAPIRLEMFQKNLASFGEAAELITHCALLLPRYAFPVGLDIVDKFAKVPNWMTKPIATYTTVQALKRSLDSGDTRTFDALRRMLCGSGREWLLRPGINR